MAKKKTKKGEPPAETPLAPVWACFRAYSSDDGAECGDTVDAILIDLSWPQLDRLYRLKQLTGQVLGQIRETDFKFDGLSIAADRSEVKFGSINLIDPESDAKEVLDEELDQELTVWGVAEGDPDKPRRADNADGLEVEFLAADTTVPRWDVDEHGPGVVAYQYDAHHRLTFEIGWSFLWQIGAQFPALFPVSDRVRAMAAGILADDALDRLSIFADLLQDDARDAPEWWLNTLRYPTEHPRWVTGSALFRSLAGEFPYPVPEEDDDG